MQTIDRRAFLRAAAVGPALAAVAGAACRRVEQDLSLSRTAAVALDLDEITIAELHEGMTSGRLTARSIVEAYLDRIDRLDRRGPTLRSVIETNPDALALADERDRERREGRLRGSLHGIPVLLKDNIGTADGMTTTAGSLALEGSIPAQDAFVAQRLRQAGAILLGKANMSEWANIRSARSSSGWSARGGQCRNPYVLNRNPCGSSAGSGAAVAANLAAVAIGTETDGSIVCPSSSTGLVGIKPTVGLVSRSGIIPISHSQDTAGPMTRTVRDAAWVLTALAGVDPSDVATSASEGRVSDYASFLDPAGLKGARLGVARNFFGFHERVDRVLEAGLEAMRAEGAVLIDPVELELSEEGRAAEMEVLLYELKTGLNAYLATLAPAVAVRSLADVIAFNEEHRELEMPYFEQELFLQAAGKGALTDDAYLRALALSRRLTREGGIDALMETHQLDAVVAPTGGPAWLIDLVNGDHFGGGSSSFAAIAGYPNITVPAGDVFGLPVGMSFFGRAWSEPTLIRIAYAFEQTTRQRTPPQFLPTLAV